MKLVLGVYDPKPHPYHYKYIDDTWVLSDIFPRFPHIVKVDARDIPYDSLEAIYASHILEHVEESEVLKTLKHWYDKLEVGGWVHINVPDIEWALDGLMKFNCGKRPDSTHYTQRSELMKIFNGSMESVYDTHKSWFNREKLRKYMKDAGFCKITIKKEYEAHQMGCLIARGYKCP